MPRFLKIGVLLLCTAVFCWGVQYKLSLYHVAPDLKMPAAKLLTDKAALTQHADEVRASVQPAGVAILFLLIAECFSLSGAGLSFIRSAPQRARGSGSFTRRTLVRFAFRPPPSLA